jgi:hypothetical protein
VADVAAVEEDAAFLGEVEALQQLGERALAGAGGAHQGQHAAGLEGEREVAVEEGAVLAVAEADSFDVHPAALGAAALGHEGDGLDRGVHDVAEALDGDAGLLGPVHNQSIARMPYASLLE